MTKAAQITYRLKR